MSEDTKKESEVFHFSLTSDQITDLAALINSAPDREEKARLERAKKRMPGRLRGKLVVGPEFFEPLTGDEIKEIMGE